MAYPTKNDPFPESIETFLLGKTDAQNIAAHQAWHEDIGAYLNRTVVWAGRFDSLASALAYAEQHGKPKRVLLDAGQVYDIAQTLVIPVGVTLDLGGATLRATSGLDPIVSLEASNASVTNGSIDANNTAVTGVFIRGIRNQLRDINLTRFDSGTDIAVKAGGALYTSFTRVLVSACAGRALDARISYRANGAGFYGLAAAHSQECVWGGKAGAIYLEGIMSSTADKIEVAQDANSVIEIPDNGDLYMANIYMELTKGAVNTLTAFKVGGTLVLNGGHVFGGGSIGSTLLDAEGANMISLRGIQFIYGFENGLKGTVANACVVDVGGNRWSGSFASDKRNLLTNLDNATVTQLSVA